MQVQTYLTMTTYLCQCIVLYLNQNYILGPHIRNGRGRERTLFLYHDNMNKLFFFPFSLLHFKISTYLSIYLSTYLFIYFGCSLSSWQHLDCEGIPGHKSLTQATLIM